MRGILILVFVGLAVSFCRGEGVRDGEVRKATAAGQFYTNDKQKLTNTLKSFFDDAAKPVVKDAAAIIVPHAGYVFSGQIAADAFNQVRNNKYDVVVVLGTNHTAADFNGISVYPKGAFETPLGNLPIDEELAAALQKAEPSVTANLKVHEKEHSIEVELPFIQYLFPEAKILPIIVSSNDPVIISKFAHALAGVIKDKRALIAASSDLSHYPKFDDALKTDNKTLHAITTLDINAISSEMQGEINKGVPELVTCACGEAPILAAAACAKELGAKSAKVISYSNSGYNPMGNVDKCVGYGAVAICRDDDEGYSKASYTESPEASDYQLTEADKQELLQYARKTLAQYFWTETVPIPHGNGPLMKIKRGVFVTLRLQGNLHGCIGHAGDDIPVYAAVGSMTLNAAFNDSRFDQLQPYELPKVRIEISALTPFKAIKDADEIELSRDGVLLKKGSNQAVFLPQVAAETGWSKEKYLNELSLKAGLKEGEWKDSQLYTFRAEVFAEKE